jgi:xylan 1,4-beta-xylosidase
VFVPFAKKDGMSCFDITIDVSQQGTPNTKFWTAAGLDSLYALTFTEGGQYLLDRMREKGTCRYLRNHHALSDLTKEGFRAGGEIYDETPEGKPVYSFDRINKVYAEFVKRGLKPIVEMDYLPKKLRQKEEIKNSRPSDWDKWAALLRAFTKNLADTFGPDEIRTWYFEAWNEPDNWPVEDWPQFYRLYDVFVDCVTSVDDKLRVGGPGGCRMDFLRGFLEHVANGTNYVTGKKGSRIDFISYHIYGMSGSWLASWPLAIPTVQHFVQELLYIQRNISLYPALKDTAFHLNEWGVCSHYEKNSTDYPPLATLRDSEFSALFLVKLVDSLLQLRCLYGMNIDMLLYWGFCAEDSLGRPFNGNRSLTTAGHISKPVQTAHEMLGFLGDTFLPCRGIKTGGPLGALAAAQGKGKYQVLVYQLDELDLTEEDPEKSIYTGSVTFTGLEPGSYCVELIMMDDNNHNTYRLWRRMGSPRNVEAMDLPALRECGDLKTSWKFNRAVPEGVLSLPVNIAARSMQLFLVSRLTG